LIDHFQVDAVIFTGVAGALDPELNIGDIVISSECMQHDMDVSPLGFARGMIPYQDVSIFPADPLLVEHALQVCRRLFNGKAKEGRILSGDQFIADRDTVKWMFENLGGACTEMEGSSVAQVCHMNKIPYVVIRSMSDKADGSAHMNFPEFTQLASKHSYQIVEGMLRTIH
jgi:adenosylhomocysteine nucleosidase